jgi:hypothetical protein
MHGEIEGEGSAVGGVGHGGHHGVHLRVAQNEHEKAVRYEAQQPQPQRYASVNLGREVAENEPRHDGEC